MTLYRVEPLHQIWDDMRAFWYSELAREAMFGFLHRQRDRRFPHEAIAHVFAEESACSMPPLVWRPW